MPKAMQQINTFSSKVLRTRGGRIGSGMGNLLEALWGFYINDLISKDGTKFCELAWFPDHQFNDFACITKDCDWDPATKGGEYFRIEVKSMNLGADESKAHFDVLMRDLDKYDSLLLLVWHWAKLDHFRHYPKIIDNFFGLARPVAILRDALHITRGGTFVDRQNCPDGCPPNTCRHHGEPLNENGKRERLSGPESRRPSANVSYAANFGGLVRMLKTRSKDARKVFREKRNEDEIANKYISFIHRIYPTEEQNHYSHKEWREIASKLRIDPTNKKISDLCNEIRKHCGYEALLRTLN